MGSRKRTGDDRLAERVFLEVHRSVTSFWSDLVLQYYMGSQMGRTVVLSAANEDSCLSMPLLDGMGCDLLNVSCLERTNSTGHVCQIVHESACRCPAFVPAVLQKLAKVPPLYACENKTVNPKYLINTLVHNGLDLAEDFGEFMTAFHLSAAQVLNPRLIRPENHAAPRYHLTLFDLVGLTDTNPALLDVKIPVGQCVLNTYFFTYCIILLVLLGIGLHMLVAATTKRKRR